jgi:hypothetical protein
MSMRTAAAFLLSAALIAPLGAQCPPGAWSGVGLPSNSSVNAMGPHNGDLVASGFLPLGGTQSHNIARWDGTAWHPFTSEPYYAPVALTVYGGDLVAGGSFPTAGGITVNGVARWTGTAWQPFGSGIGTGIVHALAVYGGDLVAGGNFTTAGGAPASSIARWDGTSWHALGSGISGSVYSLAVFNGELIAAGYFLSAGGAPASNIAAWNGSSWHALGTGLNDFVLDLGVYAGELVAAGGFTAAGGTTAYGVASWNGASWRSWGTPELFRASSVAVYDFELHVAGFVSTITSTDVFRWDGIQWQPLGLGVVGGGDVHSLVHDGSLFVGAFFISGGIKRWSRPVPRLGVAQPGGAGTGVVITTKTLTPGHEYFQVASTDLCSSGAGSGSVGGLCFADPSLLAFQLSLPVGTEPFHFVASAATHSFGPFALPVGFAFEALCADVTGGTLGCVSSVARHFVY